MLIDDILEALRKESIGLDEAVEQIRERVVSDGDEVGLQTLLDRVDRSQQAGLPSSHARRIRDCLDEAFAGDNQSVSGPDTGGDDDTLELTLEPLEEEKRERPTTLPPGEFDPEDLPTEDDGEPSAADPEHQASAEDDGLPPIQEPAADPPRDTTDDDDMESESPPAPAESDEEASPADTADEDARHEVIMETRSSIPSSEERDPNTSQSSSSNTTMIGALLASRYELLTRITHDAYGTVYRARDHDASDRDPDDQFCGIRLLPSSLAQRDDVVHRVQAVVKRLRRLQHPGILPTYDVKRDAGQAWIVTRLPSGTTLARFIRRECVKGLPANRALSIVRQIGAALQAAHKAGMPHGDLKPASIFIASDDSIQISDFGLRPALFGQQLPSGQAGSTEIEQMDPMDAYLTAETMEGSPPEPSDDVYALACITAALLTGGHPFNGQSGLRRVERDTRKPRLRQLNRHQNRVLDQALVIWRSDRIQTVDGFLEELAKKRGKTPKLPFAVAAGMILVVGGGWYPVQQWLAEREEETLIESLEEQGWPGMHDGIRVLPPEQRAAVLPELRDRLVARYTQTINTHLEDQQPLEADSLLNEALGYYPESERLLGLREQVDSALETAITAAASDLRGKLAANDLGVHEGEDDVPGLITQLERLAPDHPATDREDLRGRYRDYANRLAADGEFEKIRAMVAAADQLFPADDPVQRQLADAMARAETQQADQASNEITTRLEERLPPVDMAELETLADDWRQLLRVSGGHPILNSHQDAVDSILSDRLDELMAGGEWNRANAFLREYAPLWATAALKSQRRELTMRSLENGYQPESLSRERNRLADKRATVEELLDAPRPTSIWRGELLIAWREMLGWMRPGRNWMAPLRERVETHFLEAAESARRAGRAERARGLLATGRQILPESRPLQRENR